MKNPEETIAKMQEFTLKIAEGYYKSNFVLTEGYYKFIDDLHDVAMALVFACKVQLSKGVANDN